jgi:hypothetical protein
MEPLVEVKVWVIPVAALIPLIIGFIWYNPKVLGKAWMDAAGMTEESMKGANKGLIFFLSYVFANMIGLALLVASVHQLGLQSLIKGAEDSTVELGRQLINAVDNSGNNFRSFKHGSLHGTVAGVFFAFAVLATNALFERKSWKYIWINAGYWIISMGLMGGVICQFA